VGVDSTGQIAVNITFNDVGATEWSKITTAAFNAGASSPFNRVAIFLDNNVITAPNVNGVSSNKTQITGNFTSAQAQALASAISAGALPAEIATVSSTAVSATLGSADGATQSHRRRRRADDHRALHDRLLPVSQACWPASP